MPAQNAVVGDEYGTTLPQTQIQEADLAEEKKLAKYSKTAEFKRLKDYIESRVEFYQVFLPDGREVGITGDTTGEDWRVANRVIAELKGILSSYQNAQEVVDVVSRRDSKL